MTAFDNGIALQPAGDGLLRGRTVPEWANMVGPFGGITAAALLRAIELQPDVHGQPVALTVNYLAPIVDGDFEISTRAVRTNRSNQHWLVELSQDGEVKTTATAVFGIRRDTWSDTEPPRPAVPAPQEVPAGPDAGPTWMRNYDMRYVTGAIPDPADGESASSETTLWVARQSAPAMGFRRTDRRLRHLLPARLPAPGSAAARGHRVDHGVLPRRHRQPWPPRAMTMCWQRHAHNSIRPVISTRPPRSGGPVARCWPPATRSSTSRMSAGLQ